MKILQRKRIAPIYVAPGDTLSLTYDGKVVLAEPIVKAGTYDTAIIFTTDDQTNMELGLSYGIGGIFAKSDDGELR